MIVNRYYPRSTLPKTAGRQLRCFGRRAQLKRVIKSPRICDGEIAESLNSDFNLTPNVTVFACNC